MSLTPEALSTGQQRSLQELKGQSTNRRVGVLLFALTVVICLIFVYSSLTGRERIVRYNQKRSQLVSSQNVKVLKLVESVDSYHTWFLNRGTSYEYKVLNAAANLGYSVLLTTSSSNSIIVFLVGSWIRVAFVLVASLRLWLLAIVLGAVWKIWRFSPHKGNDFLGITGNGRFYYSGIRAGLDKIADDGAPDIHVQGLICLPEAEVSKVEKSKAAEILRHYDVLNSTTKELLSIILAHADYPAYVAPNNSDAEIEEVYEDNGLYVQTIYLLKELLSLHSDNLRQTQSQSVSGSSDHLPVLSSSGGKFSPELYSQMLSQACQRVLTPSLTKSVKSLSPLHIATVILSVQTGKCLGYENSGGRWIQKTSFLPLSARATLHSTRNFGQDYSYHERMLLRQALIYASRRSAFGPVALPVDISREVQALRSWAELLFSTPGELSEATDRVELYCLCWELEKRFVQNLLAGFREGKPEIVEGLFYSKQDMLFMPLKNLLRVLLQVVPKEIVDRLEVLVKRVSELQQGDPVVRELQEEPDAQLPPYLRVLAPLSSDEVESLKEDHELAEKDIKRWSAMRMILFSYSWLGRQIGHVAVPDSSVVYAIMKSREQSPLANRLGLIGVKGVVPIRASRLTEALGNSWKRYPVAVHSAAIADSRSDYEALLNGQEVKGSEDLGSRRALEV